MKFKTTQINKMKNILAHYGAENQKFKTIEALQELREAIVEEHLNIGTRDHIIEEVSDVYVMLEQLRYIYHISDEEILDIVDFKLDRQLKRIKNE